jgi:protein SCO1/2
MIAALADRQPLPSGSDLQLIDHFGQQVSAADWRGQCSLVLFGFTHCRVVCPRALARYSAVLDQMAAEGISIRGLYISVDPARDSPQVMREFLALHPRFTGLTGNVEQIERAKAAFRVFARHADDPDDPLGYRVPHTAIAYLLDTNGNCVAHFADALSGEEVLIHLRSLLET